MSFGFTAHNVQTALLAYGDKKKKNLKVNLL